MMAPTDLSQGANSLELVKVFLNCLFPLVDSQNKFLVPPLEMQPNAHPGPSSACSANWAPSLPSAVATPDDL